MHFGIEKSFFQKLVRRMKLFLSLQFSICHVRAVIKIKIFHSYRTRVARVALVLHLYCTRVALVSHLYRTHVAHVSLVLHSRRTRVVCVALASLLSGSCVVK